MEKCKHTPTAQHEQIVQQILSHYTTKGAQDASNVMKQIIGSIFESILKSEMENHLGYEKHECVTF